MHAALLIIHTKFVRFVLGLLLFALTGCRTDAPSHVPATKATLDHLLTKMNERLTLMEAVAQYKWAQAKPIEDPEREAVLLRGLEEKAKARQFSATDARWFFAAQIEAAKLVQSNHLERWKLENRTPPSKSDDLADVRQRIDAVNDELLTALIDYRKHPADQSTIKRRVRELLHGEGIDERVRAAAIQPLLSN